MSIKAPPPQPVRLLPRNEPAPAAGGRQRALRQQFRHAYAEPSAAPAPIEAGAAEADPRRDDVPDRPHAAEAERPQVESVARHGAAPRAPAAERGLAARIARACARDEQANLRNARLAAIIARFCNAPAILDHGAWQLQIAIDPALLPATRLHLTLSSCRLSLRFETGEHDTRRVILDNSEELRHRLHALLPAQIEVDIVCW